MDQVPGKRDLTRYQNTPVEIDFRRWKGVGRDALGQDTEWGRDCLTLLDVLKVDFEASLSETRPGDLAIQEGRSN